MVLPVESYYLDRPLNFAHRGASHEAPDNTLAAFLLAAELGADGIEFDVQLSRDGEVVVIHDFVLETTTDGQGPVADKTLAELKELDAGSWFDPGLCRAADSHPARGDRRRGSSPVAEHRAQDGEPARTTAWRQPSVRAIEENHLLDRVVVSSFNPLAAAAGQAAQSLDPHRAALCARHAHPPAPALAASPGPSLRPCIPIIPLVDAGTCAGPGSEGYRVHVWTVDDPGDMWQLMRAWAWT